MNGRFISLEGGEGAGKSSCLRFLEQRLTELGHRVLVTREPGGTELAERLRSLLLEPSTEVIVPDTELLLMFAARAQHLATKIRPALTAGYWVLCDRFVDSSLAYQGYGRGIALERVQQLADWTLQGCLPDLTLLFDVPIELGLARAKARSQPDRFEQEQLAFFERVRSGFLQLAQQQPERFYCLDATRPQHELWQQALDRCCA